jgi:hypothetical protein
MKQTILIVLMIVLIVISVYTTDNKFNESQISGFQLFEPLTNVQVMGSTDYGYVLRGGPYGNRDAPVKVAYILGVHPMEFNSHKAILEAILNRENNLNYCYYIYMVKVTCNVSDYNNGRINGQLLASKYAVPDIISKKFSLAVDIHSNRGFYKEKRFIAVPGNDKTPESIADQIINKISWLVFYVPPAEKGPTSGPYVAIPLIKSGVPAIVYETYMYESYETTLSHANEFISAVDTMGG